MNHREHVDAWLGAGFAGLPHDQKVAALERAFSAMWLRASNTLGEVTLGAIGERVLAQACDRYPFLIGVSLAGEGLLLDPLREREPPSAAMDAAVRHLLVELLTLLGSLTAEIMTPALHDALRKTPAPKPKPKKTSTTMGSSATQAGGAPRVAGRGRSRSRGKTK